MIKPLAIHLPRASPKADWGHPGFQGFAQRGDLITAEPVMSNFALFGLVFKRPWLL